MSYAFGIILFYKMVWWFDSQNIGWNQGDQSLILLINIYYAEYIYIYLYMYINV